MNNNKLKNMIEIQKRKYCRDKSEFLVDPRIGLLCLSASLALFLVRTTKRVHQEDQPERDSIEIVADVEVGSSNDC